jgi:hypothetical protein
MPGGAESAPPLAHLLRRAYLPVMMFMSSFFPLA